MHDIFDIQSWRQKMLEMTWIAQAAATFTPQYLGARYFIIHPDLELWRSQPWRVR